MKIASVQMVSNDDVLGNLQLAQTLIGKAVQCGASFVVLPENFAHMSADDAGKAAFCEDPEHPGQLQQFLQKQASQHAIYLLGGTIPLRSSVPSKVFASSLLYDPHGKRIARYDKMHLFDVQIDAEERYTESTTIVPGERPVVCHIDSATLGLSVCYDLRFPELYRWLSGAGAQILLVPAAFTEKTGRAHWETLLRARAIENLAYVVAPNQGGRHPGGRETFGHSMIVAPWGTVLAHCEYGNDVILADIDLDLVNSQRKQFQSSHHRRLTVSL